jgi:hypothetical protein
MNAALWRSDNKLGNPKYLGDKRVPLPPRPPQIYRGMGLPCFGFVADKVALGQVFHSVVQVSVLVIIPPLLHIDYFRSCS